jgi:hypothetical protein
MPGPGDDGRPTILVTHAPGGLMALGSSPPAGQGCPLATCRLAVGRAQQPGSRRRRRAGRGRSSRRPGSSRCQPEAARPPAPSAGCRTGRAHGERGQHDRGADRQAEAATANGRLRDRSHLLVPSRLHKVSSECSQPPAPRIGPTQPAWSRQVAPRQDRGIATSASGRRGQRQRAGLTGGGPLQRVGQSAAPPVAPCGRPRARPAAPPTRPRVAQASASHLLAGSLLGSHHAGRRR